MMIAFASMLTGAAKNAGMKIPKDPESDFDRKSYPHFWVFCRLQLCRPVRKHGEHFENARIIAEIPEAELKTMCLDDFLARGLSYAN